MKIELKVQNRTETGTPQVRRMRAENKIPGVIYTKGKEAEHISVDSADFFKVYREAGTSAVINLDLDGKDIPVLIREVQTNPIRESDFLHVDFLKLDLEEKVKINIPIVLVNRDNIRLQPSILMQLLDNIEVECLPTNIPQTAEIDVMDMTFDAPKLVSDTDVANMENVVILTELDRTVCTLSMPSVEQEEDQEVDEDASADVPVIGEDQEG